MSCLWKQVVCKYHCEEWGGILKERLGLAPMALKPAPFVIQNLSLEHLSKQIKLYLRQYISSNVLSILNLSGFTVCE